MGSVPIARRGEQDAILHRYEYVIGWIFGPWLLFFGLLVFKFVFFPAS
jgi:hypothetical protein